MQNLAQTDGGCCQQITQDFETLKNEEPESQRALTDEVTVLEKAECNCDGQKTITQLNATVSEL